ncbi:MAG: thiamine pyrophosphate-dependent dehydrogenase E1 component subunit alpha [Sedimentibacter sp.]|uniref:thiamine pyrophosphate-dependent dehydrogenase E1 component subunit alpha n=1 Tax=Sedimentibacter sp. TaxID=1960295 RepID=UPI00298287B4|nr:thiamine pyrophosphate-dependent dehydrogenase E1 component subunit alpha [Sedimentibacter sp.]MDW5299234.1 thiamine pyrophosphate-dependent dehydrogenase E1 component subunit alpha [Sedimentibacter sp.]
METYGKELLKTFYYKMVKIRKFEETIERYFLDGEIPGFVHLYIGEEAIATGVCANLNDKDYIASTHRGHGHTIAKGADLNRVMAEIFGRKTGFCKGKGGSMHIADFSVGMLGANGVVGGGFNLATGAALAIKKQHKDNVSVVFFGDGSSNRGTFHEALNLASVWKLPVIYVCENNQWASTTPYKTTTSVEDISKRAAGYNMPSKIVDGNDVFAVYEGFKEALEYTKAGNGPFFLEAKTYRIKGHFVGDPELYRTKEEVQEVYDNNNPIDRFEEKVLGEKLLTQEELDEIKNKVETEIKEALEFAMNSDFPDPSEIYEDLYV